MEIWKDVVGYEGLYQISNKGNIKGRTGRLLKSNSHKGYKWFNLHKESKVYKTGIHRLVAQAFIDNPDNKPLVNHKDLDKSNNCVNNLEWCTAYENSKHFIDKTKDSRFIRIVDTQTGEIVYETSLRGKDVKITYQAI